MLYSQAISRSGNIEDESQKRSWTETYYSEILKSSSDLKTDACCDSSMPPAHLKPLFKNVHEEVVAKYYGCGLVIPSVLSGARVLDLGCGSGRDCFLLAQLVGEHGSIVGVDMTEAGQLEVARRYVEFHREKFGYEKPNTTFIKARIEDLATLSHEELQPGTFDVIVSNCVVNLVPEKRSVFEAAFKLLKRGGELYFSDVYSNRRMPADLIQNRDLWGECLSGALYWNDFLRLVKQCGFGDARLVEDSPIRVNTSGPLVELIDGRVEFFSATYRLFKLPELEPDCEDYGQAVVYKGGVAHSEHAFVLDDHHTFRKGKIEQVCGNTWLMLAETRFAEYFDFFGNFSEHFGLFEGCGKATPFSSASTTPCDSAGACC